MINKVTLIGNLGKDPEVRRLESGTAVARLVLATNESYKDKNGEWQTVTEWHTINCWRMLAERVETQLKKGMLIYVEGKLTTRKWTDKDGNDRYSTEITANSFRLLEKRDSNNNRFPDSSDEPPQTSNFDNSNDKAKEEVEEATDDLPF